MDAEIGVRDLADSFRYNVLPDIITALGLARDKLHGDIEVFEDLPEYEKLSMLVCHFSHGGTATMSNSMLLVTSPSRAELCRSMVFCSSKSQYDRQSHCFNEVVSIR